MLCYFVILKFLGEVIIPAGMNNYPFSAALPPAMPSSFEGSHGHVRYTVEAKLKLSWKFDKKATALFQVVSPIDLNLNLTARVRIIHTYQIFFLAFF